jgi:hypothetical protein
MIDNLLRPQQRYELLKEVPPEILDRILVQFCEGKALSTLALTCATSHRYESLYQTIWIQLRLMRISDVILSKEAAT